MIFYITSQLYGSVVVIMITSWIKYKLGISIPDNYFVWCIKEARNVRQKWDARLHALSIYFVQNRAGFAFTDTLVRLSLTMAICPQCQSTDISLKSARKG